MPNTVSNLWVIFAIKILYGSKRYVQTLLSLSVPPHPYSLQLLNRRPPFGLEVISYARNLPEYYVTIEEVDITRSDGQSPVEVELAITCGIKNDSADPKSKKGKSKFRDSTVVFVVTSTLDFVDFRRIGYTTYVLRICYH